STIFSFHHTHTPHLLDYDSFPTRRSSDLRLPSLNGAWIIATRTDSSSGHFARNNVLSPGTVVIPPIGTVRMIHRINRYELGITLHLDKTLFRTGDVIVAYPAIIAFAFNFACVSSCRYIFHAMIVPFNDIPT